MKTLSSLPLVVVILAGLAGACGESAPQAGTAAGARLAVAVAPLTLPDLTDACYALTVTAGTVPQTAAGTAPTVWSQRGLCADRFGDGRSGLSFVGTCDASVGTNTVSLVLERLCTGGGCDPSLVTDPRAIPSAELVNPCPASAPCRLEAPCAPNADTPVTFNLTVMRSAGQGFFDVALDLDDVFCSAKLDCVDATTGHEKELLFDGDARGPTAVLALACTVGPETAVKTVLSMTDITLTCADGFREVIDPSAGDGGNVYTPSRDADLFQVGIYEGAEALDCVPGIPCHKRYWNVAMGIRWASLVAHHGDCAFAARATVSDGPLVAGKTPEGTIYPVIDFAVPATGLNPANGRHERICGAHGLGADGKVATHYVGPAATGPFCSHYDGVSSERDSACGVVTDPCAPNPCAHGGTCAPSGATFACACPAGYVGATCAEPCPVGQWGVGCATPCAQGACIGTATCDAATGAPVGCDGCLGRDWVPDCDGDGAFSSTTVVSCDAPTTACANGQPPAGGWLADPSPGTPIDCDDADPAQKPGQQWYADCDGDGVAAATPITACATPTTPCADAQAPDGGWTHAAPTEADCDDESPARHPGQAWYHDCDGDAAFAATGTTSCAEPTTSGCTADAAPAGGWSTTSPATPDCDDEHAELHPGQVWYADCDGDLSFSGAATTSCAAPSPCVDLQPPDGGFSHAAPTPADCNDEDATRYPGQLWYPDCDGDGAFPSTAHPSCDTPGDLCADNEPPDGGWLVDPPLGTPTDCNDEDDTAESLCGASCGCPSATPICFQDACVGGPGAPTDVVATAGIRGATLTWSAPSDHGSPITGYQVWLSLDGGAYVPSAATVTGTTASVTGLAPGGTYTFEVVAVNVNGDSPASSPSNAVTLADVPGAPTGVGASGGNTQAIVSWTEPASTGGSPITGYIITASDGTTATSATATPTFVTGLTNGVGYTFTVQATNAVGTGPASAPSNPVVPAAPAAAQGPKGGLGFPDMLLTAGTANRLVAVDLNGDGRRDIAATDYVNDNRISVFLADDHGGFAPRSDYLAGSYAADIAAADFDADGHPDLVVTNYTSNTVSVYRNQGAGTFAPQVTYATGISPGYVVTGDFNRDGHLDFLVDNAAGSTLSVFLNTGDGTFVMNYVSLAATGPVRPAVGDFNRDGKLDVAVPFYYGGLQVLLGNGDGTFTGFVTLGSGPNPVAIETADFDQDGKLDLAVSHQSGSFDGGSLGILFGDGTGAFGPLTTYATGGYNHFLSASDVNDDGKPDLAVADYTTVSVLLNNGNGTFATPVKYTTAQGAEHTYFAGFADMNADGRPDLLGCNHTDSYGTVSVLWNIGGGRFAQTTGYPVGAGPQNAVAGDYDGDGKPDLAVTASNGATIYLGDGLGRFTLKTTVAIPGSPLRGAAGDFDRDGRLDLVVPDYGGDQLYVLLGHGDGTFTTQLVGSTHADPYYAAVADVNGDGKLDVVLPCFSAAVVEVWLGGGDGTFTLGGAYATGSRPIRVALRDFDRDGAVDVAVASFAGGTMEVLRNHGDGTLAAGVAYNTVDAAPYDVAAGDLDGDGAPDLVVTNSQSQSLSVFRNDGLGLFPTRVTYTTGGPVNYVALADYNVDGKPDLATTADSEGRVKVLLNQGDGTFTAPVVFAAPSGNPFTPAAADLDGDARPDLVYVTTTNQLGVMLNKWTGECGSGSFGAAIPMVSSPGAQDHEGTATGDFNRDGKTDLIVTHLAAETFSIQLGHGDGTFAAPTSHATGHGPYGSVVGDVNRDGKLDVIIGNTCSDGGVCSHNVGVYLGDGFGGFAAPATYPTGARPRFVALGDFNRDGRPDLVTSNADATLSVLINAGDGTFGAAASVAGPPNAAGIQSADVDVDGKLDLVLAYGVPENAGGAELGVYLGRGDGTFGVRSSFGSGTGRYPVEVAVGELNGDGRPDVVVGNSNAGYVSVYLNQGEGSFTVEANYDAAAVPTYSVALADLDGNGRLDIATTSMSANVVSVLLNKGDGTFRLTPGYATYASFWVWQVTAADFNGDGRPDLAGFDSVFLNRGTQTCGDVVTKQVYGAEAVYGGTNLPENVTYGDVDLDGDTDMISAVYASGHVKFHLNDGAGAFSELTVPTNGPYPVSPRIADFNRDGKPDVVVADYQAGTITILANGGTGTSFSTHSEAIGFGSPYFNSVAVGDVSNDGKPDVVVCSNDTASMAVLLGTGTVNMGTRTNYTAPSGCFGLALSDVNGDGRLDAIIATNATAALSVLMNTGGGAFATPASYALAGTRCTAVQVGDLNGDGKPDLVGLNDSAGQLDVFVNAGDGTFGPPRLVTVDASYASLELIDINRDGKLDLLSPGKGATFSILPNLGNGTFAPEQKYPLGALPYGVMAADLNNDGTLDIFAGTQNSDVRVLLHP